MNEMAVTVERTDAREWSDEQMEDLFSEGFPPFITADRLVKQYIGRVREWFPEWNLIMVDAQQNPVATGWGIPVRWDGTVADLPAGYTDAMIRAVEGREQEIAPDTLVICGAVVAGRLKGRGLAGKLLAALRDAALEAGLTRVIARAPHAQAAVPADPDRDVHDLDQSGRHRARPVDPHPPPAGRSYPSRRPRLADHDRHRRRVGTVVRHRTAVQRRLRHSERAERAAHRPRGRPGHLRRTEHLDPPPLSGADTPPQR
jgi:hypothetical protein